MVMKKKKVALQKMKSVQSGKKGVQAISREAKSKVIKKAISVKRLGSKKSVISRKRVLVRGVSLKKVSVAQKKKNDKIVVTAALPYANGSIHIGHLLEYIQADIFTRFLKLQGKDARYICASDMHGTPIEVNAAKAGVVPEKFVEKYWEEHKEDFASFLIEFDEYYKTHSVENKELAELFYTTLKKKGYIYHKKMAVMFCEHCRRSLPDRFVKGVCPKCHAADQYGDVCEQCGSVLKAFDLIKPYCVICKNTPIRCEKEHYFFKLSAFATQLQAWLFSAKNLQSEVRNWLQEWMRRGLEDWCISRDAPYFGFEIPGAVEEIGEKRFFYVWLDAPIGYISSTKHWAELHDTTWEEYWYGGEVYHFIGKDIAYFHFLFWPAMLMAMGIALPTLTVHGFITVDGQKMSKSRGTFFTAKDFIALYPVEGLRFYYAMHLDRKLVDVDLNLEEFRAVNNNVLMGSLGNFCYRVLTFAQKNYGEVSVVSSENVFNKEIKGLISEVEKSYAGMDFKSAVRGILQIADAGNAYFQQSEVWKSKESAESRAKVGWCVNLARNLAILISPVLPEFSSKVWGVLGEKNLKLSEIGFGWLGKLHEVPLLVVKIDELKNKAVFPLRMMVGEVVTVRDHPNADSLYLLQVDFGDASGFGESSSGGFGTKQIVAGLKKFLTKEELQGKRAVFCVNMKPAKLRGEMSEGMILVGDDGARIGLLNVEGGERGDGVVFDGMDSNKGEVTYEEFTKLKMEVRGKRVVYEGRMLKSGVKEVVCEGVKEGARVK